MNAVAGENNILDLEPDAFMGALDELGIVGDQREYLMREYQNRQGTFTSLLDYLTGADQAVADRGNRRANMLPVEVPQGSSVFEAIKEGTWDWAVPQSAIDTVRGTARGVDAFGNALAGVPYTEQQAQEAALSAAGAAMLGGGLASAPTSALRSNAPSWFGKKVMDMTKEEKAAWLDAPHDIINAHHKAKNMAVEQNIPISEAVAAQWAKVDPNPVPEANFIHVEEPDDLIDLESIDYDTEFEPIGGPPSTVLAAPPDIIKVETPKPSWHGKHILDMTDEEFADFQNAGSPKSDHNSGVADADGKTVEQWLDQYYPKEPEPSAAQPTPEDQEYSRLLDALQGNGGVPMPRTDAERRAVEVADMLSSGRGSEITDSFYDAADLSYLRRLYDAGMTGRTLPMDFKSRMERAADQGFNTGNPVYRGRGSDRPHNSDNNTFTSDEPAVAASYVPYERPFHGNMVKLLARSGAKMPEVVPPRGTGWSSMGQDVPVIMPEGTQITLGEFMDRVGWPRLENYSTDTIGTSAFEQGFPGVKMRGIRDPYSTHWDEYYGDTGKSASSASTVRIDAPGTANLRSPTAFFDPRLTHLMNYSAANASPLAGTAALAAQEDDARNQLMRYLDERENRR